MIPYCNNNAHHYQQNSACPERPRLHKLLESAIRYPLIAVYAGAGYGKTRAVYAFLEEYDAYTTWLQLTERDNVATRFWQSLTHMISLPWPEAGARFTEIGFPETDEAFAKFESVFREASEIQKKQIIVLDDFHLLTNPVVLRFLEKACRILPHNTTVILLSRTMPEINMTGMLMNEQIYTLHEDTLRFTEDEISAYFNSLGIPVTRQDVRDIYDDTSGWAFAINLIGRSMRKDTKYERYALEAMKANVFKLIGTEIAGSVSESLWRFLLRISLLDDHAASLIRMLADEEALLGEMESLNAYIRYDYYLGAYMIHNLFLEYLRQHQDMLTDEEKRETFDKAGVWCENNNYQADALSYYEKAGNWDAILQIVYTQDFPAPPDVAKHTLDIIAGAPDETVAQNPWFPAIVLKLEMSLGRLAEASASAERFAATYLARPDSPDKHRALAKIYGSWAMLQMISCTYSDVYDFDAYFEKQHEYYDRCPDEAFGPVTNMMVSSYTLLVGTNRAGAPEEYIAALSRAIPHVSHVLHGSFYGLDDLARGELHYFRRELNSAEQYLKQALDKARAQSQYDIQNRALLYLMLIALSRSDIGAADALLLQMEALLEARDYAARFEAYDIARSHYYLALGRPEQLPDWLKTDFSPYVHPAFPENFANRIKAQYHYLTQQYNALLAFLENARDSQTVLIGHIVFKVLEALSLYQLKRRDKAIRALTEAYELAAPNRIIVPFTQYAKDMRTLTAAALKDVQCTIPKDWLENVNRKSSAFAKRQSTMVSESKSEGRRESGITLTRRETEILSDLSQGLSRSEIAASQNISVNTVKMVTNTIYNKLCVTSLPEAIRIAVAQKIV